MQEPKTKIFDLLPAPSFITRREQEESLRKSLKRYALRKDPRISEDLLDGLGRLVEIGLCRQSLNNEVQPSRILVPINMRINFRAGPKPFLGGTPKPN